MQTGTVWEDRETHERFQVDAVTPEGKVQISPLKGGGYRIMAEKSLRSNYQLVSMDADKVKAEAEPEPPPTPEPSSPEPPSQPAESPTGRAKAGRVQMPDGKVVAGSDFILDICGKSRDDTYRHDSAIRWLRKPDGQALLKEKGATIVYGQAVTK